MADPAAPALKAQLEQARREAYVSCVLEAAQSLFEAQGYRGITMADIAQKVGVSKGTLYNYFESKDALFAELVDRVRKELFTSLDVAVADHRGWEKLEATAGFMMRFAHDHARMLAVYQDAVGGQSDPCADPAREAGEASIVTRYRTCLEELLADGAVRTDLSAQLMAETLAWSVKAAAQHLPAKSSAADIEAHAAALVSLFRHGAEGPRDGG